jgi:hypothetical protein
MATIEYAYKPIMLGGYHINVIYRADVGPDRVMSFYASNADKDIGISEGVNHLVEGAIAAANGSTSPSGVIKFEEGTFYGAAPGVTYDDITKVDYDTKVITSGSDSDLSAKWSAMKDCGQEVAAENLPYSALTQNSNSAAYTCTKAAGMEAPAPDGITGAHWTPAADHILPTSKTQEANNTSYIHVDQNGEQHLQINDADGNMLDLVQLEDGGLHATLSNAATQTDSTTQYQANGDVVGSFTTEHQPNTLPSSDAYATVLQKVADQNSALDDQALEAAEIRAVAGAQGADASNDFAYQRAA